jgi:cytochrome c-type biogenesis protein CcmE
VGVTGRTRSPARLVVALAVAGVLAVFLIYTAVGGSEPLLQPSNLAGHNGNVSLTGKVVGKVKGDAGSTGGLRFTLHNIQGASILVPVVYRGAVPDLFKTGREVNLNGHLNGSTFVSTSMTTKCPSKYTTAPNSTE